MAGFIFKFFIEIIFVFCAICSVLIVAHGEPVSDMQFYCWVFSCLVWLVIASIRKD